MPDEISYFVTPVGCCSNINQGAAYIGRPQVQSNGYLQIPTQEVSDSRMPSALCYSVQSPAGIY